MAVKGSRQNRKNVEFSTLGLDPPLAKCGKIQKNALHFLTNYVIYYNFFSILTASLTRNILLSWRIKYLRREGGTGLQPCTDSITTNINQHLT